MLSFDFGANSPNSFEPTPEPWLVAPQRRAASAASGFAALSQTSLASRFVAWAGLSGRTYVFSVYAPAACPAFCDAILLAVARDDGERRVLAALDTGVFPEPILARAARELGPRVETLEFHMHLLARSSAERRAALADLEAARA